MRTDAAQWELEGPRITGPITSLKMLGRSPEAVSAAGPLHPPQELDVDIVQSKVKRGYKTRQDHVVIAQLMELLEYRQHQGQIARNLNFLIRPIKASERPTPNIVLFNLEGA